MDLSYGIQGAHPLPGRRKRFKVALAISAVVLPAMVMLMIWLTWPLRQRIVNGVNDFSMVYAAAKLAGTPGLYNPEKVSEIQLESTGYLFEGMPFIRLPYYAALVWPLGQLPYKQAYLVWQVLNLAACVAFVALWPRPARPDALVAACASVPIYISLANGQDLAILLLLIVLAIRLVQGERPLASGLVISLCAAKFHLFTLVPIVILGQKRWRVALGFLAGGTALILVSFLVAGLDWPVTYARLLMEGRVHDALPRAPNFFGLSGLAPGGPYVIPAITLCTVVAVWYASKSINFEWGVGLALAGSLLIAPHLFLQDTVLLLPAALIFRSAGQSTVVRSLAFVLLTPFPYLLALVLPWPWGAPLAVLMILLVASIVLSARKRQAPAADLVTE